MYVFEPIREELFSLTDTYTDRSGVDLKFLSLNTFTALDNMQSVNKDKETIFCGCS